MVKENKMASVPVGKLLLQMAIPLILSMLVQALYNIFDSMFVSYIDDGGAGFNAVSLAVSIQQLMIAVGTGIGVGMNAFLSKSLGEKNQKGVNLAFRSGVFLALCSALIFLTLAFVLPKPFLSSQSDNLEIILLGSNYLQIVMAGSIFLFLQFVFERALQATGRAHLSMLSQISGAVTNIILDPIFIFTLKLGVSGAAYATVIGQAVGAAIGASLNILFNKDISILKKKDESLLQKNVLGNILKVGIPSTIMVAISSIMIFGMNYILNRFSLVNPQISKDAQNAFGAYFKLQTFVFMPVFGLNNALVPIVAFNYGRRNVVDMKKALKYALISAFIFMCIGTILFEVIPSILLKIFNAEGGMLEIGTVTLRILAISFPLAAIGIVFSSWFQALGNGIYSMIVSLTRQLFILLPVAYLFSLSNQVNLIWWSFPIAEIVGLSLSIYLFCRINKKVVCLLHRRSNLNEESI